MLDKSLNRHWQTETSDTSPWTRWWWFGCAVERKTITNLLETYQKAGLGGVEITFIYCVKGQESRNIEYLSPEWMDILKYTISEADRLGMKVDIPLGSGWRIGGGFITDDIAAANLSIGNSDTVTEIHCKPSGELVKRSGPGGGGKTFNPFSRSSLKAVTEHFTPFFKDLNLRSQFHDSWEYKSNMCPEMFDRFREINGYRIEDYPKELSGEGEREQCERVRYDFHITLAEMALEDFIIPWTEWCHELGHLSRNQAHGSPGNQLDLYAAVDIPETESYRTVTPDTPLIVKLASSAAHVNGRPLASSETGTWCKEHFHVTLADMKGIIDDLFLSGINHIIYHGTAYSPPDTTWPGWLFYASAQLNPQNSVWRDFDKLNSYVTRCQSILQGGKPDNEVLVYLPIHDIFHDIDHEPGKILGIKGDWLTSLEAHGTFRELWRRGYGFDYISDRQLENLEVEPKRLLSPGGKYRAIVVPPSRYIPLKTLEKLSLFSSQGAQVIFLAQNPDIPGMEGLNPENSGRFRKLLQNFESCSNLEEALNKLGIIRESLVDIKNLFFIRRQGTSGHDYFIVNGAPTPFDGNIPLSVSCKSVLIMDLMTGSTGEAQTEYKDSGTTMVRVQLKPGESVILRTGDTAKENLWKYEASQKNTVELQGDWEIDFIEGGPGKPPPVKTRELSSWTEFGKTYENFAGTARYRIRIDRPFENDACVLDLGTVHSSARVYLNGKYVDTLIGPCFTVRLDKIMVSDNILEIEVTNLSANRIRNLDRKGIEWKIFEDINFIDWNSKPFDASNWPLLPSGLLGPVRLLEQ